MKTNNIGFNPFYGVKTTGTVFDQNSIRLQVFKVFDITSGWSA